MKTLNAEKLFPIGSKVQFSKKQDRHRPIFNATLIVIGYDDISNNKKYVGKYIVSNENNLLKFSLPTEDVELVSEPKLFFVQRINSDTVEWLHVKIVDTEFNDQEQEYVDSIIDATIFPSYDAARDWCDSINSAGNPTIGSIIDVNESDFNRLFESYPNLDRLLDELKAAGIDTSKLNLININE